MRKRQRKKDLKKWLIKNGISVDGNLYCINCHKKLDLADNWQSRYEACDSLCYGKAVGVY